MLILAAPVIFLGVFNWRFTSKQYLWNVTLILFSTLSPENFLYSRNVVIFSRIIRIKATLIFDFSFRPSSIYSMVRPPQKSSAPHLAIFSWNLRHSLAVAGAGRSLTTQCKDPNSMSYDIAPFFAFLNEIPAETCASIQSFGVFSVTPDVFPSHFPREMSLNPDGQKICSRQPGKFRSTFQMCS